MIADSYEIQAICKSTPNGAECGVPCISSFSLRYLGFYHVSDVEDANISGNIDPGGN